MNIIQLRERIAFLNDRTASARFDNYQYDEAINDAINQIIKDRFDNVKQGKSYSFERVQVVIDELNTLVNTSPVIVPVANVIQRANFPANYREFILCEVTINGVKTYSRELSHAELPKIDRNPFKFASFDKDRVWHTFNSAGINVQFGTGTFTAAQITYLRQPAKVTLGLPSNYINPSATALSIGTSYYVSVDCDVNGTPYFVGQQFTALSTNLVSGQVIAVSNTVDCDLPEKLHDEICDIASATMMGTVEDYNKVTFLTNQSVKN
jgi:hypothetical protein